MELSHGLSARVLMGWSWLRQASGLKMNNDGLTWNREKTMNRLAIHTITTKPWSLDVALEKYAAKGIRGISVWVEALEGQTVSQASQRIQSYGMTVPALVRGGFFCDPDPIERERRIAHNKMLLGMAGELHADMLVLVVGAVPKIALEVQRKWVQEAIEKLLPEASRCGVKLAIEPLHPMYAGDKSCINRLSDARVICEAVSDPLLGVAVDVYHVWWDPDLAAEIELLGKSNKLFAFHLCDWRVPTRDLLNDRALMGDGCIDLRAIQSMMEKAGFDGWNEVEIFSTEHWSRDQDQFLSDIVTRYRALCAS